MLLTELDGFLTGVLICPDPIPSAEWMQGIWGIDDGGVAPFEDPIDVQWFADAVMARYTEIARDLNRGKPQPFFDIDERNGDVLWELWIDGFAAAMALRPDSWVALADGDDRNAADALSRIEMLVAIATNESPLDSMEINAIESEAPAMLVAGILGLHTSRLQYAGPSPTKTPEARPTKVGRNDACPCGSGKKSKRCCG